MPGYLLANRFGVLQGLDFIAFQIDEEQIVLGIVGKALLDRQAQQGAAQAHRLGLEDTPIHQLWRLLEHRLEIHMRKDVALQINTGGDFHQFHAIGGELEHAALGDVQHRLALGDRVRAAEGAVFDFLEELAAGTGRNDVQLALFDAHRATGEKGADEHHPLGILADVDEATGAGQAVAKLADIDVALLIDLRHAQEGDVQTTPVVKIELRGLVDDRLGIAGGAKVESTGRNAPEHARFGGQGHQFDGFFFIGDVGDALGHADAEVDHAVG